MSGPIFGGRDAQPLDAMLQAAGGEGWEGLENLLKPHVQAAPMQPSDRVAKNLAVLVQTQGGREIVEWIMDVTLRAPLRVTGSSLEETALNAARKQGINGVGEVILHAIKRGETLLETKE